MTKKEFANQVFQLVKNSIEADKEDDKFSKWGYRNVHVDASKCWV